MKDREIPFIGRDAELKDLQRFLQKKTASMIVIKGRRRIGKSRLVAQLAKGMKFFSFVGLAPQKFTTAQSQRDEFARQLSEQTGLPEIKADDWSKLFNLLYEKIRHGKVILFFDEISWMGFKDPDFLGKIKNAWDLKFKHNSALSFIICGSASAWIEENILSSTGFLGRVSYTLTLEELPLNECILFWGANGKNISAFEMLKMLSVTGGVPRYLEEIDPKLSAEDNVLQLCFKKGGILVNEFEHIFSNIFKRRSPLYGSIVSALSSYPQEANEIAKSLHVPLTGLFTDYLRELTLSGFIKRDVTWDLKTGRDLKLGKYRLSDNYLRFYLRYIAKNREKIERGTFLLKSLTTLPEWNTIMGLQFENLVLNNRNLIYAALNIHLEDIVSENPFFQRKNTKQAGCQIDYLIQTKFGTLYVCEIKFSKNPIGTDVIAEVQEKIKRLKRPKYFSCRPVLIHANGITDEVISQDYFTNIIDISSLLGG